RKKVLNSFIMIVLISIVLSSFLKSFNADAILLRFSLESNTVEQRTILYDTAFNSYKSGNLFNIVFGNGGGTIGSSLGYAYERIYPHNLLIEILFELGLIGLIVFMLQIFYSIKLFYKGHRNWLFVAYILFLFYSLTSGDLVANNFVFILFSLYLVSMHA